MALPVVVAIALVQGVVLYRLHGLATGGAGPWSEIGFLLPAYAVTIGVPLTYFLLRASLGGRSLVNRLLVVALGLGATAAYVGWVNGPVGEFRPQVENSVLLFIFLATLGWFIALPFLRLGLRGSLTATGYTALFDEAWRLAITLGFALFFVQLFWGLLSLFVALFTSIHVDWPKDVVWTPGFRYPATCAAASFAIGLTDVTPAMFRALRRLLLSVLRFLAVLAAGIVLLFLATLALQGIAVLWETHFATGALIGIAIALVTLYNTVYQDGGEGTRLPRMLELLVRAALVVGPVLAALAFWALELRLGQYGVSEDRLQAVVVVAILAGYLVGYAVVAALGTRAPFAVRHVNVVMALATIATLVSIHSPLVDLKRIATAAQLTRLKSNAEKFDFRYLRFQLGRHGLRALGELAASSGDEIAAAAKRALAEANPYRGSPNAPPLDRERFLARIQVSPPGRQLPDDLVDLVFDAYTKRTWSLYCIAANEPCDALLVDLDGDGNDEVVLPLVGNSNVYSRRTGTWEKVGRFVAWRYKNSGDLHDALRTGRFHATPPSRYGGAEVGETSFVFQPCPGGAGECGPE